MQFKDIIGNQSIKEKLIHSLHTNRVSHAQLIIGNEGTGGLAIALAFACFLNCENRSERDSCGKCPSCNQYSKLGHPDLISIFPTIAHSAQKKEALSESYLEEWRKFVHEQPYGSLLDWMHILDVGNKQLKILKKESEELGRKLALKTFSNGYRIIIIWHPEFMNIDASNKLLKAIEEPPEKTIFLLITDNEDKILPTILSRTQMIRLSRIEEDEMVRGLQNQFSITEDRAQQITSLSHGDYNAACHMATDQSEENFYQKAFVVWIRACFKADLLALVPWSEQMAKAGRESQKQFLQFASNLIRQALFENYQVTPLITIQKNIEDFDLRKFAPFVHGGNVQMMLEELDKAQYHIERNGNPKIIFLDLSIRMTRYLRSKELLD